MSTYVQLRKRLQIVTLALTEIASDKSKKLQQKYVNLILFRPPKEDLENQQTKGKDRSKDRSTKKKEENRIFLP